MQNVRLLIGLALVAHGIAFCAQYQVLDVCIQIKSDRFFRKNNIPADELEKYGRFGMVESPPFDKYFSVLSAFYDDYLDFQQCVEIKKNLLNKIPIMIVNDIKNVSHDNHDKTLTLLKEYRFPKFLPRTFIEKLETRQKDNRPFQHVIYKNKNNGNTRTLALRYWIGDVTNKEKQPICLARIIHNQHALEDKPIEPFFAHDYVIDLLNLLALFASGTMK